MHEGNRVGMKCYATLLICLLSFSNVIGCSSLDWTSWKWPGTNWRSQSLDQEKEPDQDIRDFYNEFYDVPQIQGPPLGGII